jgi:hypothetical protein
MNDAEWIDRAKKVSKEIGELILDLGPPGKQSNHLKIFVGLVADELSSAAALFELFSQ